MYRIDGAVDALGFILFLGLGAEVQSYKPRNKPKIFGFSTAGSLAAEGVSPLIPLLV